MWMITQNLAFFSRIRGVFTTPSAFYSSRYFSTNPYMPLQNKINRIMSTSKSLQWIQKRDVVIDEPPFTFLVSVNTTLKKKTVNKDSDLWKGKVTKKNDPFMPPFEDDLVVEYDFTKKHRIVLNKFPIADKHVLIITKDFEIQTKSLDYEDIEACLILMRAQDPGFIFFNCGKTAGASQPHKHMQSFPESNFEHTNWRTPLTVAIENYEEGKEIDKSVPYQFPLYEFKHEIRWFEEDIFKLIDEGKIAEATQYVLEKYLATLESLELDEEKPFSFSMTKDYIFITPRRHEYFEDKVSWNSLWYIGTFFVSNEERLGLIKEAGPLEVIKQVSFSNE